MLELAPPMWSGADFQKKEERFVHVSELNALKAQKEDLEKKLADSQSKLSRAGRSIYQRDVVITSAAMGSIVSSGWVQAAILAKTMFIAEQAMAYGGILAQPIGFIKNFMVLDTISPVYGAIFTTAVSLLAFAIKEQLSHYQFFQEHRFVLIGLSYSIAGAVIYTAAIGMTAATVSVSGAMALTTAALVSELIIHSIRSLF